LYAVIYYSLGGMTIEYGCNVMKVLWIQVYGYSSVELFWPDFFIKLIFLSSCAEDAISVFLCIWIYFLL